jgi:ribosomal-protein-alanine N-acetyltransferase
MSPIRLETPRLILRQWKESDYEPYIELNADKAVMEYFPSVLSRDETMAQISRIMAHIDKYGYGLFAVERRDNRQFIGFTGLSHVNFESYFTPCIEVGWRLSRENWDQGFATEAGSACIGLGLREQGIHSIYSFTSIHNKRSERVMQKLGMEKIGTFLHPLISEGDFLKEHVLYKISNGKL